VDGNVEYLRFHNRIYLRLTILPFHWCMRWPKPLLNPFISICLSLCIKCIFARNLELLVLAITSKSMNQCLISLAICSEGFNFYLNGRQDKKIATVSCLSATMTSQLREEVEVGVQAKAEEDQEMPAGEKGPSGQTTTAKRRLHSKSILQIFGRTAGISTAAPGPPPDRGLQAWTQVLVGHLVLFNAWGYSNSFSFFQAYHIGVLGIGRVLNSISTGIPSQLHWRLLGPCHGCGILPPYHSLRISSPVD
jgi:hypothetical protein